MRGLLLRLLTLLVAASFSSSQHIWDIGTSSQPRPQESVRHEPQTLEQEQEANRFEQDVLREDGSTDKTAHRTQGMREQPVAPMVAPDTTKSDPGEVRARASDMQEAAAEGNMPLWLLKLKMGNGVPK